MICIDSDCIIDFLKGEKKAVDIIKQYKEEIATTEINIFEVILGIYINKKENTKEEESAKSFFDSVYIMNIDGWGTKAAKIFADLATKGKVIEQNDCLIASIMILNSCSKIITNNIKHFSRIKGIEVISY